MAQVSDAAGDSPPSPTSADSSVVAAQERPSYGNKMELMLSLVGYAVGLGNVWRFPYLAFTYGGGAFLIPYALALIFLGLPLFVLELGLGQMLRQGTLGVWRKLDLPRLQSVGVAATLVTFFVSLYYNVILAWTVYYIGRTLASIGGPLPWSDEIEGFHCKEQVLIAAANMSHLPLVVESTGLYNQDYRSAFWCPEKGVPDATTEVPSGYVRMVVPGPKHCPAHAAAQFWEEQVLWQSSGMDDLGGFHPGMLISFTVAWLIVYGCICKGIASSGKVVYVTATLPYIALVAFSFRANSLPNAAAGIYFFVKPDFQYLSDTTVWLRAVTQIFYSLGVGFGSIIAFASYGPVNSNFAKDARTVSIINCGTSIFAGFVVFPILGFLALELSETDPCIDADNLSDLESVGISGTGLAFIAFPIAISQMAGGVFWAMLFFVMLLCLGIDSQFAMCESVVTVLNDAGADKWLSRRLGFEVTKGRFVIFYCVLSYILGLIFCTRAGVYWFDLFDYYSCVVGLFFVTFMECAGLMWFSPKETYPAFRSWVTQQTGHELGCHYWLLWKFVVPALLVVITAAGLNSFDLMKAEESEPYPEGTGYLPEWSIYAGWSLGVVPVAASVVVFLALTCRTSRGGRSGSKRKATFLRAYEGSGAASPEGGGAGPGQRPSPAASEETPAIRSNTLDVLTEFKGPSADTDMRAGVVSDTTQGIQLDLPSSGNSAAGGDGAIISNGSLRGFFADLKKSDAGEAATEAARANHSAPIAWRAAGPEPAGSARTLVKCGPWTCVW